MNQCHIFTQHPILYLHHNPIKMLDDQILFWILSGKLTFLLVFFFNCNIMLTINRYSRDRPLNKLFRQINFSAFWKKEISEVTTAFILFIVTVPCKYFTIIYLHVCVQLIHQTSPPGTVHCNHYWLLEFVVCYISVDPHILAVSDEDGGLVIYDTEKVGPLAVLNGISSLL